MKPAMKPRWITLAALALAIAGSAPPSAFALYPERPVTLLVPFAPGGANDIVGRIVADALGEALGQPVVIEHRGGAGGNIGMGMVARAQPRATAGRARAAAQGGIRRHRRPAGRAARAHRRGTAAVEGTDRARRHRAALGFDPISLVQTRRRFFIWA